MHNILSLLILFVPLTQTATVQETNTTYFRLTYDKSVPIANVRVVGNQLERSYEQFQSVYHLSFHDRMDVRLMVSDIKFHAEVKHSPYDDGFFSGGKLYFVISKSRIDQDRLKKSVDRVLTSALLNNVVECPRWLAETYALYISESMDDFGQPAQFTFRGFDDLAEEISRAQSKKELKELYAKLGATAKFFVERYGDRKLIALLDALRADTPLEQAMPDVFGEKLSEIERLWVRSFRHMR